MSTTVAESLPIGPVQAFWQDNRLGSLRSQANIRFSRDSVQQRLEDAPGNVASFKTMETCEIDLVVADMKMAQMHRIFAQASSYSARTTLDPVGYHSATSSIIFYGPEAVKLTGTTPVALDQAAIAETSTVKVLKSDFSTEYTKTTDWSISTAAVGTIKRGAAGSIADGETVLVYYKATATNAIAFVGGKFADYEGHLRLVHTLETGKHLQFYAPRAKVVAASDVAIQMAAEFGGIPVTFHCLLDMTLPPGQQLAYWSKEA